MLEIPDWFDTVYLEGIGTQHVGGAYFFHRALHPHWIGLDWIGLDDFIQTPPTFTLLQTRAEM